ncbi:hypothetical protein BOX15_Mlig002503g3 [Macrostomum lignano]|uniref:Matrin-type domain-containing protein n=1 Tax=Macrostomum lignano TaxID=282301 RepID=A0A267DWJ5_9PLAT|nr:hypothetical protein BOX15_Mlig002503g3 [Macrostomum lignano]
MADYWKSQPKYYCTACNCYMADNKVTRERHEGGKNHQENVERRLKEIRIQAMKDEREKRLLDNCFKQMNEGAAKSIGQSSDSSSTTTTVPQAQSAPVSTASPAAAAAAASGYKRGDLATTAKSSAVAAAAAEAAVLSQDWRESKTADGRVYYWNTKTRETVWERPQPKPAASANDAKPAVKSTKIRVLGNSGPTAAAPAAAPAAAASVTPATAPVVGPWTPVTSSTSTSCSTVSSQQKAVSSAQHSPGPIKRPAIIEKVLPAGSLKRSTDTDDTCTFKSKRPK